MEITPRHIEQIQALYRYGSFRRAAEKLCISQPALSRSILVLEEKLGVKFFDRAQGKLLPTPYGRMVLSRGGSILKEFEILHRDINLLQNSEQGVLTIGCGPIPAETLAGEAIGRFNGLYPNVTVKLVIDHAPNLEKHLANRALDFFVAEASQLNARQEYDTIAMPQQQGFFCSRKDHPLATRPSVTLDEILAYPMAIMWMPDRIFTTLGKISGRPIQSSDDLDVNFIECNNLNTILSIVKWSDAITVVSREILSVSVHRESIHVFPQVVPELTTCYNIVSLKNYSTIPAIDCLKNIFLETAARKVQSDNLTC